VSRCGNPAPTKVKLPPRSSETRGVLYIDNKYTNKNKRNSSRSNKQDEVTRRFHFNHSSTITNGASSNDLDLNTLESYAEDFAELSEMYRFFRINSLSVTAWVDFTVGTGSALLYGLYHAPNGVGAGPVVTGVEGRFSMGHGWAVYSGVGAAGKNARLALAKSDLHTITPWFVTLNDTSAGADADGPGVIKFIQPSGPTNTGTCLFEVEMSITFRTILDPETISAAAERRVLDRIESEARAKLGKLGEPACQQAAPPAAVLLRRR
jgi:hypothetical protein